MSENELGRLMDYFYFIESLISPKDRVNKLESNPEMALRLKKDLRLDPNLTEEEIDKYLKGDRRLHEDVGYSNFSMLREETFRLCNTNRCK